jgi:hypothetical protein
MKGLGSNSILWNLLLTIWSILKKLMESNCKEIFPFIKG